ncbi:hypothetical protein VCRA2128O98_70012 [Vibrio crassostreae]|nr:hypothetical protein VCRA2128O107_170018 [Vibrio crassostreae]CAK3604060.1 hypothetical protein VCRA2128O105_70018 [Vibrio crassostreae]CAK3647775.1 hypothetical protein VCRA2127O89_70018 [Vibrio crassostreae]CAK3763364.1 hypothetical protein VCRA2128O97_170018 [Vibrio crassostreae]CAK3961867.1 hypothetical protein VCRA2127O90_70018 [Vibrio crassostreae]
MTTEVCLCVTSSNTHKRRSLVCLDFVSIFQPFSAFKWCVFFRRATPCSVLSGQGYRVGTLVHFATNMSASSEGESLVEGDANIRCVNTQSSKPGKTLVTSRH